MKEIKNAIKQETFQFLLKNNIEGVFLTENGRLASPQFSQLFKQKITII